METRLLHGLEGGETHLRGRLKATTKSGIVSRTYVDLNTTRSKLNFDGYLRQFWGFLGRKYGLVDSRLKLGLGVRYLFGTNQRERVFLGPVVKKEGIWQLNGNKKLWGKVRCHCEWDVAKLKAASPIVSGDAFAGIKQMQVMKRLDVMAYAGTRFAWHGPQTALRLTPVLRVRENNWSATADFENPRKWLDRLQGKKSAVPPKMRLLVSYDL